MRTPREFEPPDRFRLNDPATTPPPVRYSRWASSETTWGPAGRILATVAVLVPLWLFTYASAWGIVCIAIWLFAILPMALRSIWKRARIVDD